MFQLLHIAFIVCTNFCRPVFNRGCENFLSCENVYVPATSSTDLVSRPGNLPIVQEAKLRYLAQTGRLFCQSMLLAVTCYSVSVLYTITFRGTKFHEIRSNCIQTKVSCNCISFRKARMLQLLYIAFLVCTIFCRPVFHRGCENFLSNMHRTYFNNLYPLLICTLPFFGKKP